MRVAELLSSYSECPGGCRQNLIARVWGRSRKRNEAAGTPAESNMVEGVGFCLQRLVKPSSDLSGQCKEEEGLASRDAGEGRYNTLGPAVSFSSLALSLFLTNRRERPRGRQRKSERQRKGARWPARLSSQNHSILSVTSGNSRRWRQALLTMCVKNARLEKACRLYSSAPISARFAHKGTAFSPSTCSHFGICSWRFRGVHKAKWKRGL